MKFLTLFFLLATCTYSVSNAQLCVALAAGLNTCTPRLSSYKDTTWDISSGGGFQASVTMGWLRKSKTVVRGFSLGLQYQKVQFTETSPAVSDNQLNIAIGATATNELNYFNIPIMVDFNLLSTGKLAVVGSAGLQPSLLLKYTRDFLATLSFKGSNKYVEGSEHIDGTSFSQTRKDYDNVPRTLQSEFSESATMSQPLYHGFVLSGLLKVGIHYALSPNFSATLDGCLSYGLTDTEQKGEINVNSQLKTTKKFEDKYWEDGRSKLRLLVPSFNIGVQYSLGK